MKIYQIFLPFLFITIATWAADQQKKYDWVALKKTFDENRKNYLPMIFSEEAKKQLSLKIGCDDLKNKIGTCTVHQCIESHPILSTLYIDSMIHGYNSKGQCVISLSGMRFFIPKEKLANFLKARTAKVARIESKTTGVPGGSITKEKIQLEVAGQKCLANMELKIVSEGTQLVEITAANRDKYKNHRKVKMGKVEYAEPKVTITFPKLELDEKSPKICKEKNVLLMYELQRDGLAQEYESSPIGWEPLTMD